MSEGTYRTRDGHWCRVEHVGDTAYRLTSHTGSVTLIDGDQIVEWFGKS